MKYINRFKCKTFEALTNRSGINKKALEVKYMSRSKAYLSLAGFYTPGQTPFESPPEKKYLTLPIIIPMVCTVCNLFT